jgi:hypothetical protein
MSGNVKEELKKIIKNIDNIIECLDRIRFRSEIIGTS